MKITWYIKGHILGRLDKIKNVVGLYRYNYDAVTTSIWIRCLQLIPYLKKMNVKCRVDGGNNLNTNIALIIRWQDEGAYNLVKRLKNRKVKTVLDLCVNYFDETGVFPGGYGVSEMQVKEAKKIAVAVDAIICGSEYIRKRAENFNSNTIYLPESIDLRHFNVVKGKNDFSRKEPRAIWSGNALKASEVGELYPKLVERKIPLTLITSERPDIPGVYKYIPWSYYTFPKHILSGDFCISPRTTNNTYDLGHSHFKIGVFMAQGVPAIASPLPSYKEVIGKTEGGRICESLLDWENTLDEIVGNPEKLWQWSQAAREGMKEYSTESVAKRYKDFFNKLLGE